MDELRKNNILQILTESKDNLNGSVVDYANDRIMVEISNDSIEQAKNIKELDELVVHAHTHCGIKKMISSVISPLNWKNCIIIENNSSVPVVQKRQFVRVKADIKFYIIKNNDEYLCNCINISAGGVAFLSNEISFAIDEKIVLKFLSQDFGKEIKISAKIIKSYNNEYVAQYYDVDKYDEDKIVKYVFNLIAKK